MDIFWLGGGGYQDGVKKIWKFFLSLFHPRTKVVKSGSVPSNILFWWDTLSHLLHL